MPDLERYDILVIGSGEAGKHLTWTHGPSRSSYRRGGTKIHRRIVSEPRLLTQQERDSQCQSEMVRPGTAPSMASKRDGYRRI
jgi:hypothetical protein